MLVPRVPMGSRIDHIKYGQEVQEDFGSAYLSREVFQHCLMAQLGLSPTTSLIPQIKEVSIKKDEQ